MKKKPGIMARILRVMSKMMSRIMPSCDEASQLISQSMDEKLSFKKNLGLNMHLIFCKWCRTYKEHIWLVRILVKPGGSKEAVEEQKVTDGLSSAAKNRLKNIIISDDSQS